MLNETVKYDKTSTLRLAYTDDVCKRLADYSKELAKEYDDNGQSTIEPDEFFNDKVKGWICNMGWFGNHQPMIFAIEIGEKIFKADAGKTLRQIIEERIS